MMIGHGAIGALPFGATALLEAEPVVDPTQSTATVPESATVGSEVEITVQAVGSDGEDWTTGGDTVVISVTGANTATPEVTDNEDGTYSASYTPTSAGTDSVAITLNGTAISGSPYGVGVESGEPEVDAVVVKHRRGVGVGVGAGL